jgi:hypothetical protein
MYYLEALYNLVVAYFRSLFKKSVVAQALVSRETKPTTKRKLYKMKQVRNFRVPVSSFSLGKNLPKGRNKNGKPTTNS